MPHEKNWAKKENAVFYKNKNRYTFELNLGMCEMMLHTAALFCKVPSHCQKLITKQFGTC